MLKKKKLVQFDEHDFFFFLNLSKILHFLFFKTKKGENINNLMIRRMWLNFYIE